MNEKKGTNYKPVFAILERNGSKPFWMKVGAAFENRDGSMSIRLDALPLTGKLQVREPYQPEQGKAVA